MSMSSSVVGFRPADDKWKKMKKIWDSCEEADVAIPKDVLDFFDGEYPGDKPGMEINIKKAVSEWGNADAQGFEVDIDKLPSSVRTLRFYNSW